MIRSHAAVAVVTLLSWMLIIPSLPPAERAPQRGSRDSLKNGAIAGAIAGAVGAGLFGPYLCNAVGEEGDPPCWTGVLVLAGLGAGGGAAIGAGIDAAMMRGAGVRYTVRF